MRTLATVIVVALLAVIAHRILRIFTTLGGFAHYHQHQPGPCEHVKEIDSGAEDFEVLSTGETFISSGLRYKFMTGWEAQWQLHNTKGRVYLMNANNLTAGVTELSIPSTSLFQADTFVPHGLSVWEDKKTGRHIVFVVNHPFGGDVPDRVEKFVFDPSSRELLHQASFTDKAMTVVNDVQATGENSFYFTNCNYMHGHLFATLESLLELPLTNVVHFDGQSYTVVDSGLKSPNGVVLSPCGQYLYVAIMVSREVVVYKRNQDNSLTRAQEYAVYAWPDNLQVDQTTGHLYLALHPIPFQLFTHMADPHLLAPSQVLRLHVNNGRITSSQELLYDHGELITASSTAVVHNNTLLIGSVFHKMVMCQVNVPLL